jgi:hypothetical protein
MDPLAWFSRQVSAELDEPITISEVLRVAHEIQTVELRALNGQRVIVSRLPKPDLLRFDRRLRASRNGKSASDRVTSFASRPLLGNGRGVVIIERVLSQVNEFFDLEASAVAERLGLKWDGPSRLWFYVLK